MWSDECILIGKSEGKNSYGANTGTKTTEREVFCNRKSIGSNENYQLEKLGYKGELKIELSIYDYDGEEILIFNNKKYKVHRTYQREDEIIELTCIKAVIND